MADEEEVIEESTEVIEESKEVEKAPVKRGRGRPKGTTKSGLPYVPKPKSGLGRGRPKGACNLKHFFLSFYATENNPWYFVNQNCSDLL